ncbi:PREDICTED: speckle-type POZ protein-like isoform X2 [Vollenhovia emeryi]|uniref:speckle-type POZ protein-like isoform X1 n=1 Tax=Vollenhovia emeryi TaxID=411798 RepID=UPI0005F39CB5|nr:PREDICTED: speckle-type POZ protein-like isoform X1 [Vollenhovia emeryi]XP_011863440.1 PREDICTED: speckle-type POZ protein-like isoform X2 [Vollenhovia emeryi]
MTMHCTAKLPSERNTDSIVKETQGWNYVEMENIRYTWTLNNFSCQTNPNEFRSSIFSTNDGSKWCLVVNHDLFDIDCLNCNLSLHLCLISSKKSRVRAKFKLSAFVTGGEYNTKESDYIYEFINYCTNEVDCTLIQSGHCSGYNYCQHDFDKWSYNDFICMDTDKDDRSLANITIFCEISLLTDTRNIFSRSRGVRLESSQYELLNNFGLLLENEKFCDVTLTVRGKEFQVHKAILVAQSPVFNVMFENEMKEKKTNQVDIDDMDPEVLKEMLRFIYTGKVTNLEKMAGGLLAASDKYQLNTLKVLCQEALRKSLTIENAAEILILADLHSSDQLKVEAINFINTYTDVIDTAGFKSMEKSYLHLIRDIYRAIRTNPPTKPVSENK